MKSAFLQKGIPKHEFLHQVLAEESMAKQLADSKGMKGSPAKQYSEGYHQGKGWKHKVYGAKDKK